MAEIRRSPVEVGSLSHCLQGFIHPRWLFGISEPSTSSLPPKNLFFGGDLSEDKDISTMEEANERKELGH